MTTSRTPQPTPEQWWDGLDEADRLAYMTASRRGAVGFDLWDGLHQAGITAPPTYVDGQPWEYALPNPYLEYVRVKAAEHARGMTIRSRRTQSPTEDHDDGLA